MKAIITGFGPFAKQVYNPTKAVLTQLPNIINGITIVPLELPVIYDECFTVLEDAIIEYQPDMILMLGVASNRQDVNLERVAINVKDAELPDNLGIIFHDTPIIEQGETAYFSTLDIKGIVSRLQELEISARVSNTAGTFVCNNIFYMTMHYLDKQKLNVPAGFIHVPTQFNNSEEQSINTLKTIIIETVNHHLEKEG
ncbi:MAG: pyroglutamyl-peptidase I [Candidatus Izimaplasma sp.]|nr:pyroglutamyl-peptidase I [Candidatus Izimaplasma bacterium]